MAKDFILPDIGEGIVECEVVEWLVAEGDTVKEDQAICDVMTDKALVQIPAVHDGIIKALYYKKGEVAKVHSPLFAMDIIDQPDQHKNPQTNDNKKEMDQEQTDDLDDFILPDIGEGIVECEIVEWLVNEGDHIEEDQAVCDVMTDKALVQIPAKYTGVVHTLYYKKGEIAQVHKPLFQMRIAKQTKKKDHDSDSKDTDDIAPNTQANKSTPTNTKSDLHSDNQSTQTNKKAVASPAVRRKAREMEVDLSEIPGSGKHGRIYKQDIDQFIKCNTTNNVEHGSAQPLAKSNDKHRVEPIKGVQASMAKQMSESVNTIPHFTLCDEIDVTALISLRGKLKANYLQQGIKLTLMPFFIKALSLALKQFPVLNTQVNQQCTELTYFDSHNIGIAVDSKLGLLVPNIKECELKSILDIAKSVSQLTDAAREGRINQADLKGGTITISNIGAIGGTIATPIINKPEVAIVALGKVQHLPRFDDQGQVTSKAVMQISWSGDHRVIDGATIARFNNLWKAYLEEPTTMLMTMN